MKTTLLAAGLALATATSALAAPEKYTVDSAHSQIIFSYNHLGYSTGYGMFSGFAGEIMFDAEDPAASSVTVSMPLMDMITGLDARSGHFMSDDFFGAKEGDTWTFTSTGIEVTGDNTAKITGDLTLNDVTKEIVLDATLNQMSDHPMENKPWAGFSATTTVLRSDFNVGAFAPFVSDEVEIEISFEAVKAE